VLAITRPNQSLKTFVIAAALLLSACAETDPSSFSQLGKQGGELADELESVDDTPFSGMPRQGVASYSGVSAFRTSPGEGRADIRSKASVTANFSTSAISGSLTGFRDSGNVQLPGSATINGNIAGSGISGNLSGTIVVNGVPLSLTGPLTSAGFAGPTAGYVGMLIEGTLDDQPVEGVVIAKRQ
jgi:hypothetical protein